MPLPHDAIWPLFLVGLALLFTASLAGPFFEAAQDPLRTWGLSTPDRYAFRRRLRRGEIGQGSSEFPLAEEYARYSVRTIPKLRVFGPLFALGAVLSLSPLDDLVFISVAVVGVQFLILACAILSIRGGISLLRAARQFLRSNEADDTKRT